METVAQRDFLIDVGCDLLQGYLFSQPVSPAALAVLVRNQPEGWKATPILLSKVAAV